MNKYVIETLKHNETTRVLKNENFSIKVYTPVIENEYDLNKLKTLICKEYLKNHCDINSVIMQNFKYKTTFITPINKKRKRKNEYQIETDTNIYYLTCKDDLTQIARKIEEFELSNVLTHNERLKKLCNLLKNFKNVSISHVKDDEYEVMYQNRKYNVDVSDYHTIIETMNNIKMHDSFNKNKIKKS